MEAHSIYIDATHSKSCVLEGLSFNRRHVILEVVVFVEVNSIAKRDLNGVDRVITDVIVLEISRHVVSIHVGV